MDRSERKTLERVEPGLPTSFYYDPDQYQVELEAIWSQEWVYACRAEEIASPRDYRVVRIGDERVILTRNLEGELRAFYNTCRHRGSVLCTEASGRFKGKSIICPYHRWAYSLDGELIDTPYRLSTPDLRLEEHSLYPVGVEEWGGCVFLNLSPEGGAALADVLAGASSQMANWRLDELRLGHSTHATVACNWKIFHENFGECLHCPDLHPELSKLIPIYKRGLVSEQELPEFEPAADGAMRAEAPLRDGAVTWTLDGQTKLPLLEGLSEEERARGQTFVSLEPSFFLVAHVDYVRIIRLVPLGPEQCEIRMEWLFHPDALADPNFDREHATALGILVSSQDRRACELNQLGVRSRAHHSGVLVGQEYWVHMFQSWVREKLAAAEGRSDERGIP